MIVLIVRSSFEYNHINIIVLPVKIGIMLNSDSFEVELSLAKVATRLENPSVQESWGMRQIMSES